MGGNIREQRSRRGRRPRGGAGEGEGGRERGIVQHTMTVHQSNICWSFLMPDERPDLRAAGVDVAPLGKEFCCYCLIRDDDQGLVQGPGLEDGTVDVGPFLEFQPQADCGQVVDAADDGKLSGPGELRFRRSAPILPRQELPQHGVEQARDGQIQEDQSEALHVVGLVARDSLRVKVEELRCGQDEESRGSYDRNRPADCGSSIQGPRCAVPGVRNTPSYTYACLVPAP